MDGTIKIDMKDPITGGGSATATHEKNGGTSSCSRIFEGPQVNIDVTSAGATVALGLMYLKTNNVAVAARLAVPHTLFLLDYVRPDLLMVRQLCLGLVMWDAIAPTLAWVDQQVPRMLRQATGCGGSESLNLFKAR